MPFKKFVEIGRVAYIADGPEQGKICAIVNVIDQNKVLVDGPTSGVIRQAYRLKQMHLTPIKINFPFDAPTRIVRKELTANKVDEKWAGSSWAKRLENKKKRANMTDFDRFKLRKAKSARNKIVTVALNGKKKALKKAGKL
ncbi:60S ribosomal protein L14 [Eurytemora carolleeae]|uniref:60S ribosomal protein L14 n=1 Tax=Eurytemora carolleeae TaxID=1294199 RepID=UPI000C75CA86|nr:60S ribosomal protein L14 [Eurytemora carolleeae]|eukprot:XP_023324610.1 60S ribosomal protein L14-like [Eurytemora affinis]